MVTRVVGGYINTVEIAVGHLGMPGIYACVAVAYMLRGVSISTSAAAILPPYHKVKLVYHAGDAVRFSIYLSVRVEVRCGLGGYLQCRPQGYHAHEEGIYALG